MLTVVPLQYRPSHMKYLLFFAPFLLLLAACGDSREEPVSNFHQPADSFACCAVQPAAGDAVKNTPDTVANHREIPILCYHQVRDWTVTDSRNQRTYIMPVAAFREQVKLLKDNGYHTILPDQLIAYLVNDAPLPPNPVMLTFDDADGSQYTNALPILDSAGYKGVFFVMTVVLNHPKYFTKEQVKQLAAQGHIIGCHTWDHHNVTHYQAADWEQQIARPIAELEQLTGRPIKYFAYPNGLWNEDAIVQLKKYSFTAAFQLAAKPDKKEPLFTIRRIIADSYWNDAQFLHAIKKDFLAQHEYTEPDNALPPPVCCNILFPSVPAPRLLQHL